VKVLKKAQLGKDRRGTPNFISEWPKLKRLIFF